MDRIKGFGPVKFRQIYEVYKSFSIFWKTVVIEKREFQTRGSNFELNFGKKLFSQIKKLPAELSESQKFAIDQVRKAKEFGGKLITYSDDEYPRNLYSTNQCVPILYAVGNTDFLKDNNSCAVVGTRNPSEWSISQTRVAVQRLAKQRRVIVSGLAKGIDTIAHQTALDANGKTIAVLGCGVDVYYPRENAPLQNEIKRKGLIVSEYPFGTRIQPISLQKRDKIIVGLSKNILIVETTEKGGTMNAYRAVLEQKKNIGVFTPPANLSGNFDGNMKIIKEGKTKVHCFPNGQAVDFKEPEEC